MVRKTILAVTALSLLAGLAEVLVLARIQIPPGKLFVLLESFSLVVAAFVGLTNGSFVRQLRKWAAQSAAAALLVPFALLIPYLVLSLGTATFAWRSFIKLSTYIGIPTLCLLPDRIRGRESVGWRDFAAMLSLAFPVASGWLAGIWIWPQDLYVFRPLSCVCVGAYGFLVVRNLEGVGYRLWFRKRDVAEALTNFAAFALLGIPLGLLLGFIHPHAGPFKAGEIALQIIGIYLTIAIPEELLFRGILQNLLAKSIKTGPRGRYALVIASAIFGLSHMHHAPAPNWRYAIMATLAGLFYGNVYNTRGRISASAITHALVDTAWHFWF